MAEARLSDVEQFLYAEAACLDERRWDDWLALYEEDAEYWIPSWDSDTDLTRDPNSEISLMYYSSRSGLEDRVFRLRTGRSSASIPLPRTCHMVSNVRAEPAENGRWLARANWTTHLFRLKETHAFFGHYDYLLNRRDGTWRIARKKIVVLNDVIPTVLDIYSV